jgi:phage terminase small subunit
MAKSKTSGLEDKQEMFCREYLKDLNGTQAAIRAGYSAKTARQISDNLLSKVDIQTFIDTLKEKRADKLEISAEKVLAELAKIGFSDLKDFLNNDYSLKNLDQIDTSKSGAIQSIQKEIIQGETYTNTTVKFKLHDKLSALEKIAKHIGFFEKDNEQQNKVFHPAPSEERIKEIKKKLKNDY